MYYLKYNDIDLTEIVKVQSVDISGLPYMEHSSFDVFERDGNVYNGMSYGNREISLKFIIQPDDKYYYNMYINDVKSAFYTKEEAQLYCGDETRYIWCVPVGDITIKELAPYCAECEVSLTAYDPYFYGIEQNAVDNENKNSFSVWNGSDINVYPEISIGFTKNTTFVQVQNEANGKKILIGGKPSVEGTTIPRNTLVFNDNMESTTGWEQSTAPIDNGRSAGGTLAVTSTGCGLMCGDFGSASDGATWHGCCYKKTLDTPVKDFKVKLRMSHNSTGKNGDPEHPYESDEQPAITGVKTTYYVTSTSVVLRKTANKKGTKLCTIPKGKTITHKGVTNGWAKITYKSYTGYCSTKSLKKMVKDNTVTTTKCNFVTVKTTSIKSSPYDSSKTLKTIPAGTCIRIYKDPKYPTEGGSDVKGKYYKMGLKYKGKIGYVLIENLVKANEYTVDYEYEVNTADDKTGIVEVYGFSSDNVQLFRIGLYDDNEYWEFTYPQIRKNGKDFLVDKSIPPAPKKVVTYDSNGKNVEKINSGKYGSWNEFYGELYIDRVNNKWNAYVQKIKNGSILKTIRAKTSTDNENSNEKLAYIVIYIGTTGDAAKASGMAVSDIEVRTATPIDNRVTYNFQEFSDGDVLTIDTSIPEVRLNGVVRNDLVDVGSEFFELEPGENPIRIASNDAPSVDILWEDKYL